MKYINYKNNKLSKLSLGTAQLGFDYGIANKSGKPTFNEAKDIIEYVYKQGINCFDTAIVYGESEKVLGDIFSNLNIEPFIISKTHSNLDISNSLNNLKTNSLFALLLHKSKLLYNWDKQKSVKKLKDEKKIKYFGVSIYSDEEFNLAIDNIDIDIIQIPFNIFDQRAINLNWFKKAKEKDKLLIIRSIYLQGLLLLDEVPKNLQKAKKYLDILNSLAKKYNIDKNKLCLSFVEQLASDSILLFGCEKLEQAKENISNFNNIINLDIEEFKYYFNNISEDIYNPTRW